MYGYFEVKIIMKRIWKWVLNLYYKKNKLCINRNENVLRYMKMEGVYIRVFCFIIIVE